MEFPKIALEAARLFPGMTTYSFPLGIVAKPCMGFGRMDVSGYLHYHDDESNFNANVVAAYRVTGENDNEERNICFEIPNEEMLRTYTSLGINPGEILSIIKRISGEIDLRETSSQPTHSLTDAIGASFMNLLDQIKNPRILKSAGKKYSVLGAPPVNDYTIRFGGA